MSANAAPQSVPATKANQLVQNDKYQYLDVRTVEEFSAGHPPGAINVPVMLRGAGGMSPNPQFVASVEKVIPDKSQPLVVGCKAGTRSAAAIQILSQQAYTNLVNNQGGFDDWTASGLPVEK